MREKGGKGCGLMRSRCRRGSGDGQEFSPVAEIRPISPLIAIVRLKLTASLTPPNARVLHYCVLRHNIALHADVAVTGNAKLVTDFVWCVRGPMNADAY
jgi:hypothetical protein